MGNLGIFRKKCDDELLKEILNQTPSKSVSIPIADIGRYEKKLKCMKLSMWSFFTSWGLYIVFRLALIAMAGQALYLIAFIIGMHLLWRLSPSKGIGFFMYLFLIVLLNVLFIFVIYTDKESGISETLLGLLGLLFWVLSVFLPFVLWGLYQKAKYLIDSQIYK